MLNNIDKVENTGLLDKVNRILRFLEYKQNNWFIRCLFKFLKSINKSLKVINTKNDNNIKIFI